MTDDGAPPEKKPPPGDEAVPAATDRSAGEGPVPDGKNQPRRDGGPDAGQGGKSGHPKPWRPQPLRQPTTGEGSALSPSAELAPPSGTELRALAQAGETWSRAGMPPAPPLPLDPSVPAAQRGAPDHPWTRVASTSFFKAGPARELEAQQSALSPESRLGRSLGKLRWSVLGPPLNSSAVFSERMGKLTGLPILASDLLSSVAYGPEALLTALAVGGSAALGLSLPIAGVLALLMLAVGLSYRQTIRAYPSGAGSYIVASNNLGQVPGILAAVGLLIDYILTVSVSIAAGVSAITSAIPSLGPDQVLIGLAGIGLILLGNLRGVKDAGYIFAVPTYGFVVMIYLLIGVGLARAGAHGFHALPPPHVNPTEAVGILLIGRAFASGATSMTGIEAVSNAIPSFKAPEWRNALTTLNWMIALVVSMFVGLMLVVHFNAVIPQAGQTLLSQLGHRLLGGGLLYALLQGTTALILFLAANTAYNDFPRLLFFMAANDHAPRRFLRMGERLVFINGILVLTVVSAALLVVFGGQTEALIPLYAVGVFLAFTLSQAGMVRHWHLDHGPHWKRSAAINAFGALLSGLVLVIAAVTKFVEGAWVVVLGVPLLTGVALAIRRYYLHVAASLDIASDPSSQAPGGDGSAHAQTVERQGGAEGEGDFRGESLNLVVVPVSRMNRASLHALGYARSLAQPVLAVHVSPEDAEAEQFLTSWEAWGNHVPLETIRSPYRSVVLPLTHYIEALHDKRSDLTITVVMPEVVARHWWERFLLSPLGPRLRRNLRDIPGIVVTSVPLQR
jgi:amino acid transporter